MADLTPRTRSENFLNGEDLEPITRREHFYAGRENELPEGHREPETREEWFIKKYREAGDVTVESLSIAENGTYTAPSGKAYSPVSVNVPLPSNAYLLKSIENESIATFTDGTDNFLKSLEVAIEPQQSGSGEPSPTNIRPISGWDECKVTRCGKNIATTEIYKNNYVLASDGTENYVSGFIITKKIKIDSSKSYYLSMIGEQSSSSDAIRVGFYDKFLNFISRIERSTPTLITIPNNTEYIRLSYRNIAPYFKDIQIEIGDEATTYEPYNEQVYTIDLNGTRYGGKLDVVSGVMTVDKKSIDVSSMASSVRYNSGVGTGTLASTGLKPNITSETINEYISNCLKPHINSSIASMNYEFTVDANSGLLFKIPNCTSASDYQTWLNNNNLQIVGALATPLTIQLTPTIVKSLQGANNFFASTGEVELLQYWGEVN